MDVSSASMGMQSVAAGAQASAMLMKVAIADAEQNAQALLAMLPKVSPSVNPPHLGKYVDVFA